MLHGGGLPMAIKMAVPHSNHTVLRGHSGPVYSLDVTQNGRHVLSASEDTSGACCVPLPVSSLLCSPVAPPTVRLWDLTRSECVTAYHGHAYPVFDVALRYPGGVGQWGVTLWGLWLGLGFGCVWVHVVCVC